MLRTVQCIALACLVSTSALAAEAPVKKDPSAMMETGLTVGDCLTILTGLSGLNGHERQIILNQGRPGEQIVKLPDEYGNGGLRFDISRNIAVLSAVQADAQPAQQKIFYEVLKSVPDVNGKPASSIQPGTPEAFEYDRQMRELTSRPCRAMLTRINAADLNADKNQIPISILAAIDKILDR